MEEYKKWLEQQIERCLNDKDLQREHWAFCKAYEKFTALRQPPVIRRLFDIKYHSSYGVPFIQTASYMACDEADALTQFWDGKNKESYEVTLVLPRINGV